MVQSTVPGSSMCKTPCDVVAFVLRGVFLSELVVGYQQTQDGQAESSASEYSVLSAYESALVKLTTAPFFCSSLGLLGCEILGPMEGSTPFNASSSNSTRSTNLSPYVKTLNYALINDAQIRRSSLENQDRPSMYSPVLFQTVPKG